MARKPYTTEEKAQIVVRGETRLGQQHFFGVSTVVASVKVLQTLEEKVEKAEENFHNMYITLFAQAIANLKSGQDLKRI